MLKNRRVANKKANQWCVILNPIESELNKTETIEKIVEIFPLSIEEAAQLVERTPIILLENLSYGKAKAVKNLFSSISADILLTDDTFLRR
ncbi:MAG: ribosomal protein L7/L12, partial [Candidatus Omnitrophica bacterium]|nr:ribosomal protein L7/L12 [Candidatus Omnitrophota bacterium]